jgi:hypothetical protein
VEKYCAGEQKVIEENNSRALRPLTMNGIGGKEKSGKCQEWYGTCTEQSWNRAVSPRQECGMKTIGRSAILLVVALFAFAMVARADNIHLCNVPTGCSSGSVISFGWGTTTAYLSGNPTGDELFLALLSPVSNTSGNWNNNGTSLWSVLGIPTAGNSTYPTLSSAISQELIGTGMTVGSFNVSAMDLLTTWTGNPQTISLPWTPTGTIIMAFTENSSGQMALVTPWSSSLVNVPEPSSLLMLGVGLAGVLAVKKALA